MGNTIWEKSKQVITYRGRHVTSTHPRNLIHYRISAVESFPAIIILHT